MKKFGHYEVTAELGRGGMGVVYKGWDPSLNRHVAIKALGEHLLSDKGLIERFTREAKATAALNHQNVIQIYFIGEEQGQPYFAMEFIEGESLDEILQGNNTLSISHAKNLLQQACKGLSAAHQLELVHRDIKPANIMITHDGTLKIVDFGIAQTREYGEKLTNTGEFVGTPGYLSPEVCIGQEVDLRSDIFSLGIVFYEMLAGKVPFENDSPLGLMLEVVQADIPDIRELNKKVDKKTSFILNKMIAKSPEERYQNCDEIIRDTGNVVEKQPLETIRKKMEAAENSSKKISQQITLPSIESLSQPNATHKKKPSRIIPIAASLFAVAIAFFGYQIYQENYNSKPELIAAQSQQEKQAISQVSQNSSALPLNNSEVGNLDRNPEIADIEAAQAPEEKQKLAMDEAKVKLNNDASNQAGSTMQIAETSAVQSSERINQKAAILNTQAIVKSPHTQFSSFTEKTSAHLSKVQKHAEKISKPKPIKLDQGVVVLSFGDPAIASPIEKHIEANLIQGGVKVMNEKFISGMNSILQNGADLAEVKSLIKRNGGQAIIIANVNEIGTQELSYSGRTSLLINAQIEIDTYDVKTGDLLDTGFGSKINYTSLNATEEAIDAISEYSDQLKTVVKSKINS